MTSPELKFDLEKIVRLAGGPARIAKHAKNKGIVLGNWAAYSWGKSVGIKPKYHELLSELSGLSVEAIATADKEFREKRKLDQEAAAT